MDAEAYRKAILECFTKLEKLGGTLEQDLRPLKAQAAAEKDPRKLFFMYQTLKEVLASDAGGDTSFQIKTEDGAMINVPNLAEGQKVASQLRKRKS